MKDIPELFYKLEGKNTTLDNLKCSGDSDLLQDTKLFFGKSTTTWGGVVECVKGSSITEALDGHKHITSRPTIIFKKAGERNGMLEERNSYPSFLYSVWKAENGNYKNVTLGHVYHISSSMRLVEAVVTGVVHAREYWENLE